MRVRNFYLERRTGRSAMGRLVWRNWWLVKCDKNGSGRLNSTVNIGLSKEFAGKRVRFKMIVLGDEE